MDLLTIYFNKSSELQKSNIHMIQCSCFFNNTYSTEANSTTDPLTQYAKWIDENFIGHVSIR